MTHERDIEHILDVWFADGPTEAPDRALDAVADRIERQPQQPAWRLHLRETHVNRYLKPLLAVAAVLVVAVIGYRLLPAGGVGGTSTASPSPSASPSVSFACDTGTTGCLGPLEPGEYTTGAFRPAMTYVVADGWTNVTRSGPRVRPAASGRRSRLPGPEPDRDPRTELRVFGTCQGRRREQRLRLGRLPDQAPGPRRLRPDAGDDRWACGLQLGREGRIDVDPDLPERARDPAVMLITDSGATPDRTIWIDNQVETTHHPGRRRHDRDHPPGKRLRGGGAAQGSSAKVQPVIDSMRFTPGT